VTTYILESQSCVATYIATKQFCWLWSQSLMHVSQLTLCHSTNWRNCPKFIVLLSSSELMILKRSS